MQASTSGSNRLLITGGAGFIGTNLATYFADKGWRVTVLDNVSRPGSEHNLAWLTETHPAIRFVQADIRTDLAALQETVSGADAIFHLAAQVAVTTSVINPREDFEINAAGTLNLLEAVREAGVKPTILFASTNKVYGGMEDLKIAEGETRYSYRDLPNGIPESYPLDFHSPYGCSKGAADQYVRDYARIYDIPTVVLRQSCIYGPRQFGVEDQGWIAWFAIAALLNKPITIYGNGKQVRDVLDVRDLARVYEKVVERIDDVRGQVFNIGGGPHFTLAVHEVFPALEELLGRAIPRSYSDWRPGDQPVYISDITKAARELDWQPEITPEDGIPALVTWIQENAALLRDLKLTKASLEANETAVRT